MARVLNGAELIEESRGALLDAFLATGRARAVERRLTEPAKVEELSRPPLLFLLQAHGPAVDKFVTGAAEVTWKQAEEVLAKFV
jgi:hypothetical protein